MTSNHPEIRFPSNLASCKISILPATAYYIPDFITEDEERIILDKIQAAPKPRWKQLTRRRLQTWPSDLVHDKLVDARLPAWLEEPVVARLRDLPVSGEGSHIFKGSPHERPNHVLINEYPPGDGAAYWPVVCTVSLGASLCLNIYKNKDDGAVEPEPSWRILQEPRSLLITTGLLYTDYLHGIADIDKDESLNAASIANWDLLRDAAVFQTGINLREPRTSLTYRDVLKVVKVGGKLGGLFKSR